jgi:IS30 family transposase
VEYKQKYIAKEIGVHPSTISRELQSNKHNNSYHPELAQIETTLWHKHKKKYHAFILHTLKS